MSNLQYNNQFAETNVYGHIIQLIKNYGVNEGIHLDIGAGFGAIAEPLTELGLCYIGLDIGEEGSRSLIDRGYQCFPIDLLDINKTYETILDLISGKKLASLSIIDTLEHLVNGPQVLTMLHKIAAKFNALLVISVPNTSHTDISLKLLTGSFQYTPTGLLDHTHTFLYTNELLAKVTKNCGWHEIDAFDVILRKSDQHFPEDNIILHEAPLFAQFINSVKKRTDLHAWTHQLVRSYLPGTQVATGDEDTIFKRTESTSTTFLSIIIRTQALRLSTLRDVLLCLSAQTNQDFEILLVAHKVSTAQQISLEQILEEQQSEMKNKTRLLLVEDDGRVAPINRAIKIANGHYISVLDDDDLVFAHWVENFKTLSTHHYGKVLRAVTVEQDIEELPKSGLKELKFKTIGKINHTYPNQFDLLAHLTNNYTPFMSWSFPRSLFRDFGFEFDESLHVCEDWDLAIRAVLFCGVSNGPAITSIYRKWKKGLNSQRIHSKKLWQSDRVKIIEKFFAQPHVIPPHTLREFIELKITNQQLNAELEKLRSLNPNSPTLNKQKPHLSSLKVKKINKNAIRICSESVLFNSEWYLTKYPDVKESGINPVIHYLSYGAKEGRDPGPNFSTIEYFKNNHEIREMGINPLVHFETISKPNRIRAFLRTVHDRVKK